MGVPPPPGSDFHLPQSQNCLLCSIVNDYVKDMKDIHISVLIPICIFTELGNAITTCGQSNAGVGDITSITLGADCMQFKAEHNEITIIPSNYFVNLPSMVNISVIYNNISQIESGAFSGVAGSLSILQISYNHLTTIQKDVFSGLTGLSILGM